jgi:RNA polymerase sigma-70 factor (ECF subfamily)
MLSAEVVRTPMGLAPLHPEQTNRAALLCKRERAGQAWAHWMSSIWYALQQGTRRFVTCWKLPHHLAEFMMLYLLNGVREVWSRDGSRSGAWAVRGARLASDLDLPHPGQQRQDTCLARGPERSLLRVVAARACIRTAVDALPPSQREVITLRDVEGWDSTEVCNVLQISESNQRNLASPRPRCWCAVRWSSTWLERGTGNARQPRSPSAAGGW